MILFFFLFNISLFSQGFNYISPEQTEYVNIESIRKTYKSNIGNEKFLRVISQEYGHLVTFHNLGSTHLNNIIPAVSITRKNSNSSKVTFLFNGAHHGDELISTEHCYDILYTILTHQNEYDEILSNAIIWIVPIVNPDGSSFFWNRSIKMGRKNGWLHSPADEHNIWRGVDLNRNYAFKWNSGHPTASSGNRYHNFYRGTKSFSEPESQAMRDLAETQRFLFAVSFHSSAARILYPYTIENVRNTGNSYTVDLAHRLAKLSGYRAVKNLYPVDGTDTDYYHWKYGTSALLIESSVHNPPYERVESVLKNWKTSWNEILKEGVFGSKVFLKIIDENGNNLQAEIAIENFKYYHGEKWSSNPQTGLWSQMVSSGNYILRISHSEYETQKIFLEVNKKNELKIIKMKKINY